MTECGEVDSYKEWFYAFKDVAKFPIISMATTGVLLEVSTCPCSLFQFSIY